MTNRNFPYPLKTNKLTVYGIKGCPYCAKMKDIAENIRGSVYHDIDELIKKGFAKSFADFKRKMNPFINNYDIYLFCFYWSDVLILTDISVRTLITFKTKNVKNHVVCLRRRVQNT